MGTLQSSIGLRPQDLAGSSGGSLSACHVTFGPIAPFADLAVNNCNKICLSVQLIGNGKDAGSLITSLSLFNTAVTFSFRPFPRANTTSLLNTILMMTFIWKGELLPSINTINNLSTFDYCLINSCQKKWWPSWLSAFKDWYSEDAIGSFPSPLPVGIFCPQNLILSLQEFTSISTSFNFNWESSALFTWNEHSWRLERIFFLVDVVVPLVFFIWGKPFILPCHGLAMIPQ